MTRINFKHLERLIAIAKSADLEYLRVGDVEVKRRETAAVEGLSTSVVGFEAMGTEEEE